MLILGVKSQTGFQKFSWNEETKISIRINRYESILAAWNDCSIERVSPSLQPFPRCVADSGGGARRKSTSERLKRTNFVRAAKRPAMLSSNRIAKRNWMFFCAGRWKGINSMPTLFLFVRAMKKRGGLRAWRPKMTI